MNEIFDDIIGRIDPELAITSGINTGEYSSFVVIVSMVVNLLIWVGFIISIIAIAYSMILHTMSGGDPDKTKKAWSAFINGIIAAAISLGAVALKVIVLKAFGVDTTGISLLEQGGF